MYTIFIIIFICFLIGLWLVRIFWLNIKAYYYTIVNRFTSPRTLPLYDPDGLNFKILRLRNIEQVDKTKIINNMLHFKVAHIYLIHGTFVGSDPFDFVKYLERFDNPFIEQIGSKLQSFGLKQSEKWFDDIGNFTDEYRKILYSDLGKQFSISNFYWSSSNHHYARVEAAVDLFFDIENLIKKKNSMGKGSSFWGIVMQDNFLRSSHNFWQILFQWNC